jgi:hypothetical protein
MDIYYGLLERSVEEHSVLDAVISPSYTRPRPLSTPIRCATALL